MSIKKNVIANYAGQAWTAFMGVAFVPIYIDRMGMESYGLIGVFALLQIWLSLLDIGMTPTLTREMARFTAGAHGPKSIWDLLRSIEVIGYILATIICTVVWLMSTWLAANWLNAEKISVDVVAKVITAMGMVTALRFVESLYRGAILGLQKQVWLSLFSSLLATIRSLGSILVLVYVAPSIINFFIWQVIASLLTLAILVYGAYSFLPLFPNRARFSWDQIKGVWKFSGGMLLTALLTILLTQVDKVILSRMLSLELYGYYALAGLVTGVLYQITGPITQAYYPRFTAHVTNNETNAVIDLYHQASQIISVLLIPASIMLIIYGDIILMLWTGNANLVVNASPLVSILAAGTLLNGLMHVPYILTVAYGWPSFAVRQNLIAVLILIPAIVYVVPKYGAIGAAWIWFLLNIGYLFIAAAYIFRRLISSEKRKWYLYDLFLPTIGALSTVFICSFFRPTINNVIGTWIWLMLTGTTMVICSAFMANQIRPKIVKIFI